MAKGNIDSPQKPAIPIPATPRKEGDLKADQEMVDLGGKSGSSAISSPTSPKLGGKSGQA
jgi:hypothetical protein